MMYFAAYVMIGNYFNKKRALATGIASCGSGVGTFVFAPLTVFLLTQYGWQGTMLMLAGITLNGIVCGAAYRPIPKEEKKASEKDEKLMDFTLFQSPAFVILCASSFLCLIGENAASFWFRKQTEAISCLLQVFSFLFITSLITRSRREWKRKRVLTSSASSESSTSSLASCVASSPTRHVVTLSRSTRALSFLAELRRWERRGFNPSNSWQVTLSSSASA